MNYSNMKINLFENRTRLHEQKSLFFACFFFFRNEIYQKLFIHQRKWEVQFNGYACINSLSGDRNSLIVLIILLLIYFFQLEKNIFYHTVKTFDMKHLMLTWENDFFKRKFCTAGVLTLGTILNNLENLLSLFVQRSSKHSHRLFLALLLFCIGSIFSICPFCRSKFKDTWRTKGFM